MQTNIRKIVPAVALAGIAALSLSACGGDDKPAPAKKPAASSSAPAEETTPAPAEESSPAEDTAPAEESSPADESTPALGEGSQPAAGGSGDAAACKAVFDRLQNASSEFSKLGSDSKAAADAFKKVASDMQVEADKIQNPQYKAAANQLTGYFKDLADAAEKNDMNKAQEIAKKAQGGADSEVGKAGQQIGMCMVGQ